MGGVKVQQSQGSDLSPGQLLGSEACTGPARKTCRLCQLLVQCGAEGEGLAGVGKAQERTALIERGEGAVLGLGSRGDCVGVGA